MDIRRISGPWNDNSWIAVGPPVTQPVRGPRVVRLPDQDSGIAVARTADSFSSAWQDLKHGLLPTDAVKVAVHRRSDGATLVTLYDTRTGDVIAQMPPEAIIDAVDAALHVREQRKLTP